MNDMSARPNSGGNLPRCLPAIYRAWRKVSPHIEATFQDLQVNVPEGHVVVFVERYGPCAVGELIREFGYRKPTMTSLLNRLEQRGLLRRALNHADRRSLLVELTESGAAVAREAGRRVGQLDALILSKVSERDIEGFHSVLEAAAEVAGATARAPDSRGAPERQSREPEP